MLVITYVVFRCFVVKRGLGVSHLSPMLEAEESYNKICVFEKNAFEHLEYGEPVGTLSITSAASST